MARARRRDAALCSRWSLLTTVSRRGELSLPAWIDGRGSCPPGHLFVPFFDERRLINRLTLEAHCPFSKEPDYKKCAARVSKVVS